MGIAAGILHRQIPFQLGMGLLFPARHPFQQQGVDGATLSRPHILNANRQILGDGDLLRHPGVDFRLCDLAFDVGGYLAPLLGAGKVGVGIYGRRVKPLVDLPPPPELMIKPIPIR